MNTGPTPAHPDPLHGARFRIHTFGCQMNENDSEHLSGLLLAEGAEAAGSDQDCQIYIINTCAVRAKSVDKVYSLLGRIHKLNRGRKVVIAVSGCVAQLYRQEIQRRYPYVNLVIGPDNYAELPQLIRRAFDEPQTATARHSGWRELPTSFRAGSTSGYITVMEGCNNFCTYCIVPYTRGREKFRAASQIIREAEEMSAQGYRELQLLGQNVNVYRDPESGINFPGLLRRVSEIPHIGWIRFLTCHPRDFTPELARTMAEIPQICRQLHLPIQAGADAVLKRMNRGYTQIDYLRKIDLLRQIMPDIALSTDIIVGFPGESDSDFQETLRILREVRYTNIFSFCYSPRPLTKASRCLENPLPSEIKKQRLLQVQELQREIQLQDHGKRVGSLMTVLCLGRNHKTPQLYTGRNQSHQVINFASTPDPRGQFLQVKIRSYGAYSLKGEAASAPSPLPMESRKRFPLIHG